MKYEKVLFAVIVIIIAIMLFWFYWFQWRPEEIRKACFTSANKLAKNPAEKNGDIRVMSVLYRICLVKKGLKPEDLIPSSLLE